MPLPLPPRRPACITDREYAYWRGDTPMTHVSPCYDCLGAWLILHRRPVKNKFMHDAMVAGRCALFGLRAGRIRIKDRGAARAVARVMAQEDRDDGPAAGSPERLTTAKNAVS